MKTFFLLLLPAIAVAFGAAPLGYVILHGGNPLLYFFAITNLIGWGLVTYLHLSQASILALLNSEKDQFSIEDSNREFHWYLKSFVKETVRYYRASYGLRLSPRRVTKTNLSTSLERIAQLAYTELNAQAVLLFLFDEKSESWSQGMLVGASRSSLTQAAVASSVGLVNEDLTDPRADCKMLTVGIRFAGHTFGALRVEFRQGVIPTRSDRNVLRLLADQGGIMLVDAKFTNELLRMRKAGEESVQAKTGFLANLSHELRGPLGIILNGAELMIDGLCGEISEVQRETLQMVKESGEHLLDLVNDVLDYAKVEAGKVVTKPVEIAVGPLLDDLTSVVRSQAVAKGHKLIVEPVDGDLGLICDKRHVRQMLINFLTNAVKYTPNGGAITVRTERVAQNRVKISIQDTGIGIPEAERHKVFGAFERIENNYTQTQVGTGLGMPLTIRLAEVNNGAVDFESEEGKGSTFWLILPACVCRPISAGIDGGQSGPDMAHGYGETVLLVEHDSETRRMLEKYLTNQGFAIVIAENGQGVMRALRESRIEIAVIENDLPDTSGEEVVTAIRSNPNSVSVPIILLSSRAFVFDIERYLKLGVDRCLSKPVPLMELAVTVRRLIDETKEVARH